MGLLIGSRRALLGGAGILPFFDDFDRANGALGGKWIAPTWTIDTNQAKNTPTEGEEKVANGTFAAWTTDNPDGWTVTGEVGADPEVSEVGTGEGHGGVGTGMCNLYQSATVVQPRISQTPLTVDAWYVGRMDIDTRIAGTCRLIIGAIDVLYSSTGSKVQTTRAKTTEVRVQGVQAGSDITVDNVSMKPLTMADLFATLKTESADVTVQAAVTLATNTQAGIVVNVDNPTSPQSFVVGFHDGIYAYLVKYVSGTATELIKEVVAYGAGQLVKIVKDGTAYALYYNGVQVSTTKTISDAEIVNNRYHGMFNTYSGNRIDDFDAL